MYIYFVIYYRSFISSTNHLIDFIYLYLLYFNNFFNRFFVICIINSNYFFIHLTYILHLINT